ncbi:hypothetical protein M2171_001389 [Bradyrhizobium japonicum USDA 38]|nr:hypothetical protein [Bradyrhizobium japonicum USDA 38]MCS3944770.1 hypothetical protein [Bradyrhizobium japonicum]
MRFSKTEHLTLTSMLHAFTFSHLEINARIVKPDSDIRTPFRVLRRRHSVPGPAAFRVGAMLTLLRVPF